MIKLSEKDIGNLIEVTKKKGNQDVVYKGYLIEFTDSFLKLKLFDIGYNIGINIDSLTTIARLDEKIVLGKPPSLDIKSNPSLPTITYIGTGGTIGTHVDYVTGGVYMCRTPQEILATTPELANIVNIKKIESPIIKPSEDLGFLDWKIISEKVYDSLVDDSINGIIITHGTDFLAYTGTALSFMIENVNKPVLLVGAQRSPDRASFDGALNLICAAQFVKEKIPGVFLVMHGSINDDYCYVLNATKAKKFHTSRRDTFQPVNDVPIARVYSDGKIEYIKNKELLQMLPKNKPILKNEISDKVGILKVYPDSDPSIIDWYIEKKYKGLIIEGTGLGHVPTKYDREKNCFLEKSWIPFLKKANDNGIILIMCSQSIFGRVNNLVYANLRFASEAGVEYLDQHDMLPETAYIKLSIALSRFSEKDDILNYMKSNVSGEISNKETPESFNFVF
jgi:glutamyl-tRNA(Gln) amidotransferase subunit D